MQCNGNFKQWFNIFLIISEAWQGYESKAYGVSNHNLKLQSKKLSRTRDIPNFLTQGWADTAFYTHNWSETFIFTFKMELELWWNCSLIAWWMLLNNSLMCEDIIFIKSQQSLNAWSKRTTLKPRTDITRSPKQEYQLISKNGHLSFKETTCNCPPCII